MKTTSPKMCFSPGKTTTLSLWIKVGVAVPTAFQRSNMTSTHQARSATLSSELGSNSGLATGSTSLRYSFIAYPSPAARPMISAFDGPPSWPFTGAMPWQSAAIATMTRV